MKTQNNDFLTLVDMAMRDQGRSHMRPVIEKELLHYDILYILDKESLLDNLTFQGGTSLRLCYGAPRFSEDLDFVGGYDFQMQDLITMKNCLEDYFTRRYGLEIIVKEPKDFLQEPENRNIHVSKWQLQLVTHPERKDLPRQLIKIEIANIPAYTKEPKQLLHNYDFLPDGYSDTIVMVETLDEILADKIVAFINCQTYVRHRDIWDMHWLKQQGAKVKMELVKEKIQDYKIKNYVEKLDQMRNRLFDILNKETEFKTQMSRFLPMSVQEKTLLNEKYIFLLSQESTKMLDTLGFEWEQKNNGDLYCTNSLRSLDQQTLEQTIILMQETKDKNGLLISYGKEPIELISSSNDEKTAKELLSIYKSSWPKNYKINASLLKGKWFLKFSSTF